MNSGIFQTTLISLLYTLLIFLIAWYAHIRKEHGRSIVDNPYIYTLSIAVYCTSWTFYGSVGKAATTGIDYLIIYLGPSLSAFAWIFLLHRIIRISRENNITSIADFISLRYGRSPLLGALVTLISLLAIMPYIALQLRAVFISFHIMSGFSGNHIFPLPPPQTGHFGGGLLLPLILSVFSIMFGARRLVSSERHEGLIAAVAFESLIKMICLLGIGMFVTYHLYDGFIDIFSRFRETAPERFNVLFTFNNAQNKSGITPPFTMLFMSMGAIMLLPRQFHVMVIENCNERHISTAMWLFPLYLFLINLFIMPIALSGIMTTGGTINADFFTLSVPLLTGHTTIAMLAYLGGLSAAAGMVMVESVTISTMLLNHIFMPVIVRFTPRTWFPDLLLQLKRFGIFLVIFLGYFYHLIAGSEFMLVNLGMISFTAISQFVPVMLGGLYWRRGNRTGAIVGTLLGFLIWFYTLFLPSFSAFEGLRSAILDNGPFGISLLKPTALFGLSGMDMWSHALFWSLFFNVASYIACSLILQQDDQEIDQVSKFIDIFRPERHRHTHTETKRLSKPVTIAQFVALMAKFIGEADAQQAIATYIGDRRIDVDGHISEFELPNLKRFTEKTLAGSVGVAAAGAIVDSFLSDMGSRMELVYDIFSTVKTSLDQSREALSVRIKASEIINRTLDLHIIMDELLLLLLKEFNLDIAAILLKDDDGTFSLQCCQTTNHDSPPDLHWLDESKPYYGHVDRSRRTFIINDTLLENPLFPLNRTMAGGIVSCAHIPIQRKGETPLGIISVFSKSIPGLFTEEFIGLLESLAGQLAQTVTIACEIQAKEKERNQKEQALLQNARIRRDMEIAQQIQISLLPEHPPHLFGVDMAGRCVSATHVGGDYYDFFLRDEHTVDLLIADVSGHSVGAALIMAEVRTLLRPHVNTAQNASSILKLLNSQLYDDLTRAELFITMFYAKYNSATGRLSYANAGHNRPLVCRERVEACIELDAEGLIIGVKPSVIFEERSTELLKGDVLLFYTDGLTEATNAEGASFGVERTCSHLKAVRNLPSQDILDSFYSAVTEFTGLDTFQDDISLVVIKIL
ncbi:sodium:solute symporter family transporter [Pelobacter propionicus]|uniref:Serine phosphatase n=1 Tax=Pelobacter propionicus (strain DSM 2379 / NBRC 103807 / OttBd1) TaxID=338966 RepID=A1ASE2_PELPD|nr:SpoIIE family protein phosphatase [Pelobacter propionicus]ABL00263.1 serine phosphatase [Pelobacter propionicus DSM 2379]